MTYYHHYFCILCKRTWDEVTVISQRPYNGHSPPYCSVVEYNIIIFFYSTRHSCLFKNAIARCQLFARPDTAASARPTQEKSLGTLIVFLNRCAVDLSSRKPAVTRAYDIISRRKKITYAVHKNIKYKKICIQFVFFRSPAPFIFICFSSLALLFASSWTDTVSLYSIILSSL